MVPIIPSSPEEALEKIRKNIEFARLEISSLQTAQQRELFPEELDPLKNILQLMREVNSKLGEIHDKYLK